MATLASSPRVADNRNREPGLIAEIRTFWRLFFARAFNPYRPELHYMRGPGPAWRAKPQALLRPRALARPSVARDDDASGRRAGAVIIAMNGFSHDAAALCNSR